MKKFIYNKKFLIFLFCEFLISTCLTSIILAESNPKTRITFKYQMFLNVLNDTFKRSGSGEVIFPKDLLNTNNRADYLIITTDLFYQNVDLNLLANHRAAFDSFDVAVVTVEDIYQQFSAEKKYESIKEFLSYLYQNWAAPNVGDGHLIYVLLVGEGSKNSISYIPTYYYKLLSDSIASDNWYACINDDNNDGKIDKNDRIPDLIIGRLSVENDLELNAIVEKIIRYDNELLLSQDWRNKIALTSTFTSQDEAIFMGDLYQEINNLVANQNYYQITDQLKRSQLSAELVRNSFVKAINEGRAVINVNAHGGLQVWTDGQGWNLFTDEDMSLLNIDHPLPVVFSFCCNSGGFDDPENDCLGEILLNTPKKGAVAFWGATTNNNGSRFFDQALFKSLMENNDISLGLHLYLARLTSLPERGYNLLGDPAINLKSKTIAKLTDICITTNDIDFLWSPNKNEDETIKITIHNNGFTNAKNVIVRIFNEDPRLGEKQLVPDIVAQEVKALGGYTMLKFSIPDVKQQQISLHVKADPYNNIPEYNELNNEAVAFFQQSYFVNYTEFAGLGNIEHGLLPILGDYNNDGYLDVFIVDSDQNKALLKNRGNGVFTDMTRKANIAIPKNIRDATFVDLDNDRDLDIFLEKDEPLVYFNQGDEKFVRASFTIGLGTVLNDPVLGFFDYNNDGFLDVLCKSSAVLLSHHKDGTYADVTTFAGLDQGANAIQAACGDYDNDGDLDIFLVRSRFSGILYQNNGDSTFSDVTEFAGLTNTDWGKYSAFADYDNDGNLDLLLIRQKFLPNILYHNNGNGTFTDITESTGINNVNNGDEALFFDYDNDGYLDIYSRAGHDIGTILRNNSDGTFSKDTLAFNKKLLQVFSGIAFGDFDNDGDIDCYGTTYKSSQRNILLSNSGNDNNWLIVNAKGTQSNSFGIGARVKVITDDVVQIREVSCIFRNRLQMSLPVHFGLGKHSHIDTVMIRWPSGIVDVLTSVNINSILTVEEGYGDISIPNRCILLQNYPNPFNSMTKISYTVAGDPHFGRTGKQVQLKIFNILGQEIKTIVDDIRDSGFYNVGWDGKDNKGNYVANGVYLYQLKIDHQIATKKMLILK